MFVLIYQTVGNTKCWYLSTTLHGVISQRTKTILTSNITDHNRNFKVFVASSVSICMEIKCIINMLKVRTAQCLNKQLFYEWAVQICSKPPEKEKRGRWKYFIPHINRNVLLNSDILNYFNNLYDHKYNSKRK